MSLEEHWGFVEFKNLKGTRWQLKESKAVSARQPMLAGAGATLPPIIPEIRADALKRMLYVARGDVERLEATDGCVACTNLILGKRASPVHSACTQQIKNC